MERFVRLPLWLVVGTSALVVVVSGNLSGLGIGSGPLLYDTVALPRLAIAVVVLTIGWAVWLLGVSDGDRVLRWDAVWILLIALGLWAVASAAFSPHRALSILGQSERLEGAVTIALYGAAYGLAIQVVRSIRDVRFIAIALSTASVCVALFGVVQLLGVDPTEYGLGGYSFAARRAFANFDNPNFLGGLLVLSLPIVIALAITASRPALRVVWIAGSLVVAVALVATFSRGAWLAALVELGIVLWIFWRKNDRANKTSRWWLVAGFLVVSGVLLVAASTQARDLSIGERVTDLGQRGGSAHERLLTAVIAGEAALARPLFGYGPDAFLPAFRAHRSDAYAETFGPTQTVNNAHSWPLQYAATLGLPGALLLVAAIVTALWRSRRLPSSATGSGSSGSLLAASVWIACLGFAVNMLFSVAMVGATVPFWLLAAALGAPHARKAALPSRYRVAAAALVGGFVLVAVAVFAALVIADASYLASRQAFVRQRQGDALRLSTRARKLNPTSVKYARGVAEVTQVAADILVAGQAPQGVVVDAYGAAQEEFEWVIMQSPADYPARAWLAALQANVGTYVKDARVIDEAQTTAREASELDRQHAEVEGLARGDLSAESIGAAANVPRLP